MASFPLVPFVNRIREGRFHFRGRDVHLSPNMTGDKSPLHGQGWLGKWEIVSFDNSRAQIAFRHAAGEWPWDYQAWQKFDLDEAGLSVELGCRNLADDPMPCGLGQHPYFPCTDDAIIDTQVASAFEIDADVLPVGEVPALGRFALGTRKVCGQGLDHGFGGWGGKALLSDPHWPGAVRLSSAEARFFQLYSPESGRFFVAEPVTHANAALNEPEDRWPSLGMRVLKPGEEMQMSMRLELVRS